VHRFSGWTGPEFAGEATEALVSEIPEEKKEAAMPGGHGGGMGGMY
jgi:hypothetical protein